LIGSLLDKYEVLQKVGEGGMATVYLGRHTTLDRDVAIKVLHPHLSSSTRNRKRFAREARAIEHLRHDNILEIFDYSGTDALDCYIITEFVRGDTLTELLEKVGRLPSEATAMVGLHLARALEYAHSRGVLHRDLKPDNVMVREDGTVKLMDFGIARFLDETQVTLTGALVGSPAYMSPEQAEEKPLDHRSDLFALGTLLFQILTGHLPFQGSNPSLILKKIIEGERPAVNELCPMASPGLVDVIERLMAVDREERFTTASDVVSALLSSLLEIGIDPEEERWSINTFADDPDAYRIRLEHHLKDAVVMRGKGLLAAGDHLGALRQFNRILSMDEDNLEVLELVQGLHIDPSPTQKRRRLGWIGAAVVFIAVVGALLVWWQFPEPELPPVEAPPVPIQQPEPPAPMFPPVSVPEPDPKPTPNTDTPPPPVAILPAPLMPRPTSTVTPAAETGKLRVSANYPADVYIEGERRGSTRGTDRQITLPVGTHQVQLKGPYLKVYELQVTIAPGETVERTVEMSPRQVRVIVDDLWPGHCRIRLNQVDRGTLTAKGRSVTIEHPDRNNEIVLDCDGTLTPRTFTDLTEDARFPPPTPGQLITP
jgi:eukaryotic-like serine/threonine-protein kinase